MAKIIDNRTTLDKTIRIFDSFYAVDLVVESSKYDIVHGYFVKVCKTKNIADNFTAVLFRIAQETQIDVLDLLAQIEGSAKTNLQMNKILAYYLNSFKSKTSLYGIGAILKPNQPVARNIVQ